MQDRLKEKTIQASDVKTLPVHNDKKKNHDDTSSGQQQQQKQHSSSKKNKSCILLSLICIGVLCLAISLGIVFMSEEEVKKESSGSSSDIIDVEDGNELANGSIEEKEDDAKRQFFLDIIAPITDDMNELLNNVTTEESSRYKAMNWILNDMENLSIDKLISSSSSSSSMVDVNNNNGNDEMEKEEELIIDFTATFIIERYIAALLYYSTNGNNWFSTTSSSQQQLFMMQKNSSSIITHHCDWYGISCNDIGRISEINMSK